MTASSQITWTQTSENDSAQIVLVHEPCLPNFLGALHPNGSLYARSVDLERAARQHREFRSALETAGHCKTTSIREILRACARTNRSSLEQLAVSLIEYKLIEEGEKESDIRIGYEYFLSDAYKRECVSRMGIEQLVEVVLMCPRVYLRPARERAGEVETVRFECEPLSNLVFTRDGMIVTAKGVVLTAPAVASRAAEVRVVEFCLQQLRVPILGRVESPGELEGGDFLAAGEVSFVGIGLRSNIQAVKQLLDRDWFGYDRVTVVKDVKDQSQERMHLDTVFNVVGDRMAIAQESILGINSPLCRMVDEYTRPHAKAPYALTVRDMELSEYVRKHLGYQIILASDEMQQRFNACNVLNLGAARVLVSAPEVAHLISSNAPALNVTVVEFDEMCAMYGSLHCCSQVLSRAASSASAASRSYSVSDSPLTNIPAVCVVPTTAAIVN